MERAELRRAVEAARATVSGLGLPVGEVVVVHNSDRVALRLVPCEVLARVAPGRDVAEAEFEVDVARRLTAVGAPVGGLDPRAGARVYARDSFAITLWTYHEPVAPEVGPAGHADALLRHHAALRRAELDAPHFTDRIGRALDVVADPRQSPDLPDDGRKLLTATLGAPATGTAREQLLHGEPHPGNLLATRQGPLFVDLNTCCRGPVEFDLAHAPEEADAFYPGADPALIRRYRAVNWAMFAAWRWRRDDQMPDRDRRRAEALDRVRAALDRC
ncbi:phosphotransferase family protein [Pseudosporangium ferrugineum]|uniref:Phosphotransferase family enzyme n=1 Tax=Pseudosporangium ferrugineum TaxID=439699 RepID=A0A2T0SFB0_9ACTN|nr:phosphotransferase [Pseudosporangium ferrugineum]PRY32106.1 phosphotransferase family enzyme [Pseudosporangium ferrugineum]